MTKALELGELANFATINATANTLSFSTTVDADATTVGGNSALTLRTYTDDKSGNAFSNATAFASNADNISSGTLNTARLPATANISTAINVGANVNLSTSGISIGNSTVNSVINSTALIVPTEIDIGANVTLTNSLLSIGNSTVNSVINSTSIVANGSLLTSINATSISIGTLDTARLPATANISTSINVGANVNLSTSTISIGNSTVNAVINSTALIVPTEIDVGANVTLTNSLLSIGNSSVNSVINSTSITTVSNTATIGTSIYSLANGNVGFGNSSPATKVHVAGSLTLNIDQAVRVGNTSTWMIGSTSSEISIGSQAPNAQKDIGLYSNGSSSAGIYLAANGNLGVNNVKTPYAPLVINGDAHLTSTNYFYFGSNTSGAGSWRTRTYTTSDQQVFNCNGFLVNDTGYTNSKTFIQATSSNKVGITTTADSVSELTTSRIRHSLNRRNVLGWYDFALTSTGANQFYHMKTSMWAGGSPNGNIHPTMSYFEFLGYDYRAHIIESYLGFHNWSGGIYNTASRDSGSLVTGPVAYVSADGYVVLRLNMSNASYIGITVNWNQVYPYDFVSASVTAATVSGSTAAY